jgi:hypothetical protein
MFKIGAKNAVRKKTAYILIPWGMLLFAAGYFIDGYWGFFIQVLGGINMVFGIGTWGSVTLVEGAPEFMKMVSRHTEPAWEGEILYVDSSYNQVRYLVDARGAAWFVAKDVCAAVGVKPPIRAALRWGGVPLLLQGKHVCFSEKGVQAYLAPLAKSHEAARLLTLIRNDVLRKLNRERDAQRVYSGDTPAR